MLSAYTLAVIGIAFALEMSAGFPGFPRCKPLLVKYDTIVSGSVAATVKDMEARMASARMVWQITRDAAGTRIRSTTPVGHPFALVLTGIDTPDGPLTRIHVEGGRGSEIGLLHELFDVTPMRFLLAAPGSR